MNFKYLLLWAALFLSFSAKVYSEGINNPHRPKNKPLLRQQEFLKNRFGDSIQDNIPRINASEELKILENQTSKYYDRLQAEIPEWKNIGPNDIGGRVRSIAVHPTNQNIVYIGAAAGGIWKTENGGTSWTPIFDYENAISFGSITIDPNNPSVIYAATGEMIIGGGIPYLGNGIYKSTDAGNSWFQIGLTQVATFSKIIVHPLNSNLIYASGAVRNGGVYKSLDAGVNWQRIYEGNVTDLAVNTSNPNEIFIGVNITGMFYSSDGGNNWDNRSQGLLGLGGRISVQPYQKDTKIIYALFEGKDSRGNVFKSTDKGLSWTNVLSGNSSFFNSQGYYNNFITINPSNPDIVFAGGIDLWETVNGGKNWFTVNEKTTPAKMHADQHHLVFAPSNNSIVYSANDGGMYKSTNGGNNWAAINTGLKITQFYAMTIDSKQKNRNFGGTQDQGTVGNPSNNWKMVVGGDGFDCFLHPNDPNILFGEIYYGDIFRYNINQDEYKFLTKGIMNDDIGAWHSPFIFDENTYNLYLGKTAIYMSYDFGENFSRITPIYTQQFTAIAVSQRKSKFIFAGNRVGQIYRSVNGGATWDTINTAGLAGKYITDIITSAFRDSTVYVAFSGFGNKHIFKSTDLGNTWKSIDQNMPDIPVNSIIIHPDNESVIFAGTDVGVFVTYNGGLDWLPFGKNLPRTPVLDLKFHTNRILLPKLTLRAATHGRSVWEIEIPDENISEPVIVNPAGGEYYIGNASVDISWYGLDYPVIIKFLKEEGAAWETVDEQVLQNHLIWKLPDLNTFTARFRVTSIISGKQAVSRTFSISPKFKGAVLAQTSLGFNTYGIAFSDAGSLWVVDYRNSTVILYNIYNFSIIKKIILPVKGFYTDIALSPSRDTLFLHKMSDENGSNPEIILIDTSGNLLKRIVSTADYPVGLTYNDGILYASERDGNNRIFRFYPGNNFSQNVLMINPVNSDFGPRCFKYNSGMLHQVSTFFNSNVLNKSEITVFAPGNGTVTETIPLIDKNGIINARGIDIDPTDGNYWVSNFNGGLYKIAAGNSTTDVADNQLQPQFSVFPNPANEKISISINNNLTGNKEIVIINMLGEEMLKFELNTGEFSRNVNISGLSGGVYLIILKYNGMNTYHSKFVKM